jgi:hypothetical protein
MLPVQRILLSLPLSLTVFTCGIVGSSCHAEIIGFEDLPLPGSETFYNGNPGNPPLNVPIDGTFMSGSATFFNTFTRFDTEQGLFDSWTGWAYSNVTNQATSGFANQYSAWNPEANGGGSGGSEKFGISFGDAATVQLPTGSSFLSLDVTNTTYAALSMLNGDPFAKKFGGTTGLDPDFFRLTITGLQGGPGGDIVYSTDFYLADYRFADSGDDYVVDEWTTINLSTLGAADTLQFSYASSDVGSFGINTPTFFAADNFTTTAIPEPSATAILLCLLGATLLSRCRQSNTAQVKLSAGKSSGSLL